MKSPATVGKVNGDVCAVLNAVFELDSGVGRGFEVAYLSRRIPYGQLERVDFFKSIKPPVIISL
ncbi:MAG: hypothetical protein AAFQ82_07835 [Myxococcota bacterium]